MKILNDAIDAYIKRNPDESLDSLSRNINRILRETSESGRLILGNDKDLVGVSLEIRVFHLLTNIGFSPTRGRAGFEDFIVPVPNGVKIKRPLVIEVKSDRKPYIQRDDLRQLDDWVFDLSKEDVARKSGLGGGIDPMAMLSHGMVSTKHSHPSPHKGVLIFNGPVGQPFTSRVDSPLSNDERQFAEKRNFCVITFGHLVELEDSVRTGRASLTEIWDKIHATEGEFFYTCADNVPIGKNT